MMKQTKRTNKIYDSKVFWAILSLLCSLAMWAFITSQNSNVTTRTFDGIPVEFVGQDILLESNNLSITNISTGSVSVTLSGSRSIIGSLSAGNMKAVIDVSNIKQANDMTWSYDIEFPNGVDSRNISILSRNPETISFSVIKNASKTVPIKGSFEGSIAENCVAEEFVFEPSAVVIDGPEDQLKNIEYAWVTFGKDVNIESTYTEQVGFVLMDKDGNVCPNAGLRLSTSIVTATQPLLKTKDIPLSVKLISGGGISEDDCTVTIEPSTISIAGDSRLIDDKNSIILGSVDLSSFQSSYSNSFSIPLDDGIQNLTGVTEAKVTIEIHGSHTKTFTTDNISVKNVSSGYSAELDTKSVEVTLRSLSVDALNSIKPEDIVVVADLSDYGTTTGQVIVNASVKVNKHNNVGAIGDVKVTLTITKS